MDSRSKPVITLFHCINAFSKAIPLPPPGPDGPEIQMIKLPCSAMVRDVFLLRAFEADSDAVVVLTCPDGQCQNIAGNLRAEKRVQRVKALLDGIGLDGRRLSVHSISPDDQTACTRAIQQALSDLKDLGPNPAARSFSAASV